MSNSKWGLTMDQREDLHRVISGKEKSVQVQVMELLQQASAALVRASALAEQSNPMVSSVPVFAEMKETSKKITGMMQAVGKIKGLG